MAKKKEAPKKAAAKTAVKTASTTKAKVAVKKSIAKPLTNPRRCLQMSLLIVFKPLKAPLYLLIQKTLSPVISAKAEIQLVTHFFVRKNQNILFALRHKKVSGALRQNVRTGFPLSRE